MRKISGGVWIVLAFSCTAPAQQTSQDGSVSRLEPARFANGLEAAAAEIPFPDFRKDIALFINCAANLDDSGRVTSHFCLDYRGGIDDRFRELVDGFIGSTSITPAIVDGKRVAVELYFRVFFARRGDNFAVGVYPNWGDDADRYGPEYESPQRYGREPVSRVCTADGGMTRVNVGADGQASGDVSLIMSYGIPQHYSDCENWFLDAVANGRYIPAMRDGKTVDATYVELNGNTDWLILKRPDGS